ncbi:MAG TPA: hypothetical protein VE641_13535 [Chthoniobacterales bacterium]|jgi:hypothetical protein|nr:hypothetical protein [Chthoniobacterales bacterium]
MQFRKLVPTVWRLSALGAASIGTWVIAQHVVAQSYAPKPLTATYYIESFDENGSKRESEQTFAVRGDGSIVKPRSTSGPDGKMYTQRTLYDVGKKKRVAIDGLTESITSYALSDTELKNLQYPLAICQRFEVEAALVQGYRTRKELVKTGPVNHERLREAWYAADFGCLLVKETVSDLNENGDSRIRYTQTLKTVTLGEPDPALFSIPEWQERTPSAVFAEFNRKFNLSRPLPKSSSDRDRAYFANQVSKP